MKSVLRFISLMLCMLLLLPTCVFANSPELPEGLLEGMKENIGWDLDHLGCHFPDELELKRYYGEIGGYHMGLFRYHGFSFAVITKIVIRNYEFTFSSSHEPNGFFAYKDGIFVFYNISTPNNQFTRIIDNLSEEDFMKLVDAAGASHVYSDVNYNGLYGEAVRYCDRKDYMQGVGNNNFNPDGKLTREQFVTILARVAGADLTQCTETTFTDVKTDSWYAPSVIWAQKNGYVNGIGNGKFGVGQNIDRESLTTLFYRFADKQGLDTSAKADLSEYSDLDKISTWSKDACEWAVSVKLLTSTDSEVLTLSPKMPVTRAQAAKIFMSYDNLK